MDAPESQVVHSDMAVSAQQRKALDQDLAQQVHRRRLDHLDNDIDAVHQQLDAARNQRDQSLQTLMQQQPRTTTSERAAYHDARQQIEQSYRDSKSALQRQLKVLERDRRQAERY